MYCPLAEEDRKSALLETQVTLRSPMGAIVYETGGLLVDHGWLRLLGSGHPRLPRSMPAWNKGRTLLPQGKSAGFWLVADDVLGGFYAWTAGRSAPVPPTYAISLRTVFGGSP